MPTSAVSTRRRLSLTRMDHPSFWDRRWERRCKSWNRHLLHGSSPERSAPELTLRLLAADPDFRGLSRLTLVTAANTLTFQLAHIQRWRLLWVESTPGPSRFSDVRTVRVGVTEDVARELARTVAVDVKGSISIIAAQAGAHWSRLTRSTVSIRAEAEFTRTLEYDIPAVGMDIALWQLESQLIRRLQLRPNASLPPDPVPRWVELAITAEVRSVTVPASITRVVTRTGQNK